MQVSLKWINELIDIEEVDLNYLIEKITLGGFEVEEIIPIKVNNQNQISLDISATANRSDSLSIQGISKEIAALLDKPLKSSIYSWDSLETLNWKSDMEQQKIFSTENFCSIFLAMTVENLINTTSPNWIKQKLISSGFSPTNNLLDFQTYILLETGYPFEFYDLEKISTKLNNSQFTLKIEKASDNEVFFANNETKYTLNNSVSILRANDLPISIAGIIPNNEFSYSKDTKTILIEGSIFNSTEIRRRSRTLSLRTDRSARYEKSLKNTHLLESFYKLLLLLRISNPNLKAKLHTFNEGFKEKLLPISLSYKTIKEILGPITSNKENEVHFIVPEQITNYLNRLGFSYIFNEHALVWEVTIPYERSEDITREIDLIEEIGRLHGFNNFVSRLPKIKSIGNEDYSYQTRKKIISCLLNLGLNELIHYSLVNEITFTSNKIKLVNPLTEDYSNLRSTLLPSLVKTVKENLKQGNKSLEGFEFGHVFLGNNFNQLKEKESIAGVFGGIETKTIWSSQLTPTSWFEAKGKMEQFFNQLNLSVAWQTYSNKEKSLIFHPYRTAELYLSSGNYLGLFGQINPILAKRLNIPFNLYLFEFDFETIQNQIKMNKLTNYKEYFSYPKIIKDLSFIIRQDFSFEEIQSILYLNGTKFLSEINLLDEYRGSSIPKNYISLCLQLTFQSDKKTLENREVEEIIKNLQSILKNKFEAKIRS
uniref:phenylalanine tRNA synthetase n=1 Tax=Haslea karadagensis TaxID=1146996 RepID=UPI00220669D9|nr:phenylalanine tRNA synthetase [Haslea karadagensis]UXN44893.1 phenylalanine tRNA synthetase [Haslea karadagensis]UXN45154.1 phenylalanine tRNA synthetase [Haslea karadagensis]